VWAAAAPNWEDPDVDRQAAFCETAKNRSGTWHPLLDALPECPRRPLRSAAAAERSLFLAEKLAQRLFLPFPFKPQRLGRVRLLTTVRNFCSSQMDFVDAHLPQRGHPPLRLPVFQTAQIHGARRGFRQPESARYYLPRCRYLGGLPHVLFEAFAERCFAGQRLGR
jgi:hypothetical protein